MARELVRFVTGVGVVLCLAIGRPGFGGERSVGDRSMLAAQVADNLPTPPKGFSAARAGLTADASSPALYILEGRPHPSNGLVGRAVTVSQSHGVTWFEGSWQWPRPVLFGQRESDYTGWIVDRWLLQYLENAGAMTFTCRERDEQLNEVIANADGVATDPVQETGAWWWPQTQGICYGAATLGVMGSGSTTATATLEFFLDVPEDGYYSLSVWYPWTWYPSFSTQIIVTDGAGYKHQYRIDQSRNIEHWNYLDRFYFKAGDHQPLVEFTNAGVPTDQAVLADAVRIGGGMGSIDYGGGVSGQSRYREGSHAWFQYLGTPQSMWYDPADTSLDDQTSRFRYAAWQTPDDLLLRIHTNAGGTPGSGTGTVRLYYGRTEEERLAVDDIFQRCVDSIQSRWDSSWFRSTYTRTDLTGWNFAHIVVEVAFHDRYDPDVIYLMDPDFRHIAARGIYEGVVDFFTGGTGAYLPEPPLGFSVFNTGAGSVRVHWLEPAYGPTPDTVHVYYSPSPWAFQPNVIANYADGAAEVSGLEPGSIYYFQLRAENAGGISLPSETLGVRVRNGGKRILVVNGFDRMDWNVQETDNLRNYADQHVTALAEVDSRLQLGLTVDCASNEEIARGDIDLSNYALVDWICGEEGRKWSETSERGGTDDAAFSPDEQTKLAQYLDAGGRVFISGSNVVWDLASGSTQDKSFLGERLHCTLVADDSQSDSVSGTVGGPFEEIALLLDDGTHGAYEVKTPDILSAQGSAKKILEYGASGGTAGIECMETNGSRVVFFGFPFEGIRESGVRADVMTRVVTYLLANPLSTTSASFVLH